jgi:hypothetical protein
VSSTEAIQRAVALALQVELPTASVTTSNPDPSVEEECRKADLDTGVGRMAEATWEVHLLQEILPMTSRVTGYSENPVT